MDQAQGQKYGYDDFENNYLTNIDKIFIKTIG